MRASTADRLGAALGVAGAAGNVGAVAALWDVPGAYKPDRLDAWLTGTAAHPGATAVSAILFTLGLLALAGWALRLAARDGSRATRAAGATMALGATLNAAGTVAPLVLALHVLPACRDLAACAPVGRALLGLTLSLDALFNLLFGLGLVALSLQLGASGALGRWTSRLGLVAGAATVPVSLQFVSPAAAALLGIAGPLWLLFVLASAAALWRGSRADGAQRPAASRAGVAA